MSDDLPYLRVKNWERFQARRDRPGAPWIKVYIELLDDYHIGLLSDSGFGKLVKIWLLAARQKVPGYLPNDPIWIVRRIGSLAGQGQRFDRSLAEVKQMLSLGFLIPCGSPVDFDAKAASEKEKEIKKEKEEEKERPVVVKKRSPKKALAVDLPEWLEADVWEQWVTHRKALKKPLTEQAAKLSIQTLEKLRAQESPKEVIERSIAAGWTGLFGRSKGGNGASVMSDEALLVAAQAAGVSTKGKTRHELLRDIEDRQRAAQR